MEYWLAPLIWFLIAILLIVIESMTFNLITIWFALGAIATMFISIIFREAYAIQFAVFLGVSLLMVVTIRNYAVKKFKATTIKTNVNSLIGKKVMVSKTIEEFKYGEVKVDGNYWTAKTENNEIIEENSVVEIIEVSGVKLIVRKIETK
ncbi:NfeD family protein [Mycoplasmatota bacterium]|nr:NfeD family protein [Mycoplasmatota bacterium]